MRRFRPSSKAVVFITVLVGLTLATSLWRWSPSSPALAATGINKAVNFQGKLTNSNGTNITNGTYNMRFRLYDASTAGTLIWTEDRLVVNTQGVSVTDGIFQVNLGEVCTLAGSTCVGNVNSAVNFNTDNLYLTIALGNTASVASFALASPDPEMSPRIRFTAAPYAMNADNLGGIASTGYVQLGQGTVQSVTTATAAVAINQTSSGDLLRLQANGTDAVNISSTGNFLFGNNADKTISVTTSAASTAGRAITVTAGAAGTGASALAGGNLTLQGGAGGGTNGAGGTITITPGAKNGTGASGTVVVKPAASNDTAAFFQVQNAAGTQVLSADTRSSQNLISNGTFSVNTTGWAALGAATLARYTVAPFDTVASLAITTSAAANDGAKFNYSLLSNTTYTLSFYGKVLTTAMSTLQVGRSENGTVFTACSTTSYSLSSTDWFRYKCTFTTGTTSGTPFIFFRQTDAVARSMIIDQVQLEVGSSASDYATDVTRLTVGSTGTSTGQLYVGGQNPSTAAVRQFQDLNYPTSLTGQGDYVYAATNSFNTLEVLDISDPTSPRSLGTVATGAWPGSVQLSGRYVYLVARDSNRLEVYDVSNPAAPASVGTVATGLAPVSLKIQGRYAYVANNSSNTMQVYDLANPVSPVRVGSVATNTNPSGVDVQGRYAYVATATTGSLQIFDVSNPASPTSVGSLSITSAGTVKVDGRYAYVTTQVTGVVTVVDVSNPASPKKLSSIDVAGSSSLDKIAISGRYAFVGDAFATNGVVQVFDMSHPASPTSLGTITIGSLYAADDIYIQGRWLFVASSTGAIFTVDIGGAYLQQLQAGTIDTTSVSTQQLTVASNIQVGGGIQIADALQANGGIATSADLRVQGSTMLAGAVLGGLTVNAIATPSAPTVTPVGTTGATSYSYTVVAVAANGGLTLASTAGSTATGNATLTTVNLNRITWTAITGAAAYKVYRTVGGATQGLIATVSANELDDTGLAASGSAPTVDTSGLLNVASNIALGNTVDHTLTVTQTAINAAGKSLTVSAGQGGAGASANAGGDLTFVGGAGGGTNGAGGNVILQGGAKNGTGAEGSVIVRPSADNTLAFRVQSASAADTLLTADTSANKLVIGNATGTNTATTLLVLDSATADPATGYNGAQYYNSTTNKFRCYQGGAWTDCIGAGGGGGTLQADYTASTGGTTPEIIVDTTRNGLDIQDQTGGTIGATQALLSVRGVATASTLGASLFVVNTAGQVGIKNAGTTATPTLSYDLSFGQNATPTTRTIGVEAQATAATAGNALTISSGTGNTTGAGGLLTLQGGSAGAVSTAATAGSTGGGLTFTGGQGGNASGTGLASLGGTGGSISITAGAGGTTVNGASAGGGGTTTISGGAANAGAGSQGATLTLAGGAAGGTGGSATLQGGIASGVLAGGAVTVQGGTGGLTGGAGGLVTIRGGNAQAGASAGGGVAIQGGTSTTTGTAAPITITGGAGVAASNTAGGIVTINSGAGGGSAAGGQLTVQGGQGGATGAGAPVTVQGGSGGATSGNGGQLNLTGGAGTAGNSSGGYVVIQGGAPTLDAIPGGVTINGAAAVATGVAAGRTGGVVSITAGAGSNGTVSGGAGGSVTITAGSGSTFASASGGAVNIVGGAGNISGPGGNVNLTAGGGATANGSVVIQGASTSGVLGGNVLLQGGANVGAGGAGSVIVKPQASSDSATAFQVQSAAGTQIFAVDTTGSRAVLGNPSTTTGALLFNTSAGANTVALAGPTANPAASFTLNLPTTTPGTSQCLLSGAVTATQLTFGSCAAAGGVTSVGTFSASSQTNGANITGTTITFGPADATNPGMVTTGIQTLAGDKTLTGNTTFTGTMLQKSDSATAFNLQDSTGTYNNLLFDSSTNHLKVYDHTAPRTAYADIYYSGGIAVFAASSGTTQLGTGSGGGGDINLLLTAAPDALYANKTYTAAAAYSVSDFNITRNITGSTFALTGNVAKIEDLSTFTSGSSAPNVLLVNQNNTSATGNLIVAQTGGATTKFAVSTAGVVSIASGQSITGLGALTVASAAATGLTLTGNAASTWSTSAGNITIQAGGASKVIAKPGTDSTSAFEFQNAAGTAQLVVDTTNSALKVGGGDVGAAATVTLVVLDNKSTAGDPATAVNGAMYYNAGSHQYRCYRDSYWENCGINPIDRGFVIEDEFMSGAVSATTATPGFGEASWTGYTVGATACAAYTYNNATPAPTADRPGVIKMTTGAAANTGCNLIKSTTTGGSMVLAVGNVIKAAAAVGSLTNPSQGLRIGATSQTTTAGRTNTGVWWEADPFVNANWQYCYGTGAAATCASSGVAIAANTFVRLEIRITALGASTSAATFIINGTSFNVSAVTIDTATRVSPNIECQNTGANAVAQSCYVDYYQIRGVASAAR